MSILIKNLNLLKNATYVLHCNGNGKVVIISPQNDDEIWYSTFDAVEILTPHGRLIDADVLCKRLMDMWNIADADGMSVISSVMSDIVTPILVETPTVIEAEE